MRENLLQTFSNQAQDIGVACLSTIPSTRHWPEILMKPRPARFSRELKIRYSAECQYVVTTDTACGNSRLGHKKLDRGKCHASGKNLEKNTDTRRSQRISGALGDGQRG